MKISVCQNFLSAMFSVWNWPVVRGGRGKKRIDAFLGLSMQNFLYISEHVKNKKSIET